MSKKDNTRKSYKIKPFIHNKNYYWVGITPYEVCGDSITPLVGLGDNKDVEKLKTYLKKHK